MSDHDQRFKILIEEFFAEVLQLFYPEEASEIDFRDVTWLKQEVFPAPPTGERLLLDLVARVGLRKPIPDPVGGKTTHKVLLVHLEIEARASLERLRPHMYDYYRELRRKYDLPVWPIALLLRVALDGFGMDSYVETLFGKEVQRINYWYIGLPALNAEEYLQGDNWIGVALSALMRIAPERRGWLKAEAMRRLVSCGESDQRRFLLCECVQAYLPLEGPQLEEYEVLLRTEPYREVLPMATTWFEQGMEKGMEKGREGGQRDLIRDQLEARFGELSDPVKQRLADWPGDRLKELGRALVRAKSLRELGLED